MIMTTRALAAGMLVATASAFAPPLHLPASRLLSPGLALSCHSQSPVGFGWRVDGHRGRAALRLSCGGTRRGRGSELGLRMQEDPGTQEAEEGYAQALQTVLLSVGASAVFGGGVWATMGSTAGLQFFSGYLLEESLSVDNLFVFLLLFEYFKVPKAYQPRVLSWGIGGAIIMRAAFVFAGLAAIEQFKGVLVFFAAFLIFSSYKIISSGGEEEEDLSNNKVVKFAKKVVNSVDQYDGDRFFTIEDGVKRATPLLLVLACVELSDVLFAVDSIPAVFGVTQDPFLVLSSNIFAIISLRALFTVVSDAVSKLKYVKPAVAIVLGLVGVKMIVEYLGVEVGEIVSLGTIIGVLGGGVALSLNEAEATVEDNTED